MSARGERLPLLTRFLTLWIFLAMAFGVGLGYVCPEVSRVLAMMSIDTTSIPIAIGLILMMYPPLARVEYERMGRVLRDLKLLSFSLTQNWVVGPIVMFILAIALLRDMPTFMMGVILVGLARCIAMVIVWNELAKGDRELAVGLVAFNAIFQVLFYAIYIYIFITLALTELGLAEGVKAEVSIIEAAKTVFIYLGIPFIGGVLTRYGSFRLRSREWFENVLRPKISPITPIALLFTIVVMFSLKGEYIVELPYNVFRVAIPLILYFLVMWFITFFVAYKLGVDYPRATAVSFTAASNDFELAIAVAIAIWGVQSDQAFATVIGPLIEVPVLISLVNVALRLKEKLYGMS
jgi:ACR3 family arsenite transporter